MNFTDLPWDLESEILSRVPATSLNQLRLTCKQWYTLFKDPNFARKNLSKAASQQVILKNNQRVYSVNINLRGINNRFDPSIEFIGKLKSLKDSSNHVDVKISHIFHCDGLLLCTTPENPRLVVWNPCTGKTRWIQPSYRYINYKYALGYEKNKGKSCNNYKILTYSFYYNDQKLFAVEFEIYEFNSDSWRLLDVNDNNWNTRSLGVSLNGNTYWVASDKQDVNSKFLLKFDFTRERFERLSLPFKSTYLDRNLLLSVVRQEKLSLLLERISINSLEIKIWVTDTKIDEVKDSKIQYFLVADFGKFKRAGITSTKSFLLDEEKKMVVCCRRVRAKQERAIIHIVREDMIHVCKEVHGEITNETVDYWQLLLSYVPSLVHIQQASASGDKRKR